MRWYCPVQRISDPELFVQTEAEQHIKNNQEKFLLQFLKNDALLAEYQALMQDTGNPIHRMKAITDAVKGSRSRRRFVNCVSAIGDFRDILCVVVRIPPEQPLNDLRRMEGREGLVLQGCGGDLREWVDGINGLLTEKGILQNGSRLTDVSVFQHDGLTNLLARCGRQCRSG